MFNRFPNVLLGTLILLVIVVTAFLAAQNNAEVEYRLSFPAPEHRWLEVEVLFSELSPSISDHCSSNWDSARRLSPGNMLSSKTCQQKCIKESYKTITRLLSDSLVRVL